MPPIRCQEKPYRMPPATALRPKGLSSALRGGRDSEEKNVVFNQDGTYEDLGANLFCEEHDISEGGRDFKEQAFVRSQGKWQVKDGRLVLTNNDRTAFWDQAPHDNGDPAKSICRYDILRTADGFLRLRLGPIKRRSAALSFFIAPRKSQSRKNSRQCRRNFAACWRRRS